ncbi:MAG: hypothetical protein WCS96_10130 [Victivallales bacterium]
MKKVRILMAAAAIFSLNGFLFAGEKLDIKGDFVKCRADGIPDGWVVHSKNFDEAGKVSVNTVPDTEKKAVQITSKTKAIHFYTTETWPSVKGDRCVIKAMVKGSGQGSLSVYLYPGGVMANKGFQATEEWTDVAAELITPDRPEPVEKLRVVLAVSPGASIEFMDVTAEIVKKQE